MTGFINDIQKTEKLRPGEIYRKFIPSALVILWQITRPSVSCLNSVLNDGIVEPSYYQKPASVTVANQNDRV
jgi:hypothetical protein